MLQKLIFENGDPMIDDSNSLDDMELIEIKAFDTNFRVFPETAKEFFTLENEGGIYSCFWAVDSQSFEYYKIYLSSDEIVNYVQSYIAKQQFDEAIEQDASFEEALKAIKDQDIAERVRSYGNYGKTRLKDGRIVDIRGCEASFFPPDLEKLLCGQVKSRYYRVDKEEIERIELLFKENILKNYLMDGFKLNLDELISLKDRVVPFIGSGLSTPFNLPSWGGMLIDLKDHLQESRWNYYEELIEEGDYLEALSLLKKSSFSLDTDQRIQEKIQEIFEQKINLTINRNQHNYYDLLKMKSNFYLTTNYDHIFTALRSKEKFVPSLNWDEIDNLQRFLLNNRGSMIHLHGVIHRPTTMVVTKENYDVLYQNSVFQRILTNFMANRVLMFVGFSFNDKFFLNLFEDIIKKIGGEHFLIAPNITKEKAREFSQKGLKVIGINIKTESGKLDKNDVVLGLRSIIENLYDL